MSAPATTVCGLCGLEYRPAGPACAERGCPLAGKGCMTLDCPRCGFAVPDERTSVLARLVRRLFERTERPLAAGSLADLRPGADAVVRSIDGDPATAARLTAHGLAPGVSLHVVQRSPACVIEVGETTLALERSAAASIRVG